MDSQYKERETGRSIAAITKLCQDIRLQTPIRAAESGSSSRPLTTSQTCFHTPTGRRAVSFTCVCVRGVLNIKSVAIGTVHAVNNEITSVDSLANAHISIFYRAAFME